MATLNNAVDTTTDKAKSAMNTGPANMDSLRDEAMDKAAVLYEQSEKYVRQNPFYFIGGAALLGYIVGALVSRKH